MKAILTAEDTGEYYGDRSSITKAVDNISFSVGEGEFIGVMGLSGSGKTTLLNCIPTIDAVISGHIYINGKDITQLKKNDSGNFRWEGLDSTFQGFNLLDTLTTYKNIVLALTVQEVKPAQIGKHTENVAKKLGITDVLRKYPYRISGGQRQRVASARALITNPSLIPVGEPIGVLDSEPGRMLLDSVERLNIKYDTTIMMVTHNAFTTSYAHRILFIKDGKIFNEIVRGESSYKDFFNQIMEVVTLLGGDTSNVL